MLLHEMRPHYSSNTMSSPLTDSKLTEGQRAMMDINSELAKLQATYNIAIQRWGEAKKELASEIHEQQFTKWQLEHQKKRSKDYESQIDKIQMEIATLKSHLPMISEGFSFLLLVCVIISVNQPTSCHVSFFFGNRGRLQTLFTRMDFHELGVLLLRFV